MGSMIYVVYQKDLDKDLGKAAAKTLTERKIKIKDVEFRAEVEILNVSKPKAIQDDMLLKRLIRAKTDPVYNQFLNDVVKFLEHIDAVYTQSALDRAWDSIQADAEKAHKKILSLACPIIDDYLRDRNEGKRSSKMLAYKKYKAVLAVAGATAASGVAIAGAVASGGAAIAGAVVAVGMAAKATTGLIREFQRQAKDVDEIARSLDNTMLTLQQKYNLVDQNELKTKINNREVGEKFLRDLFETNIPSIKKMEQDAKLLKRKAEVMLLEASKRGAEATRFHDESKQLKRIRDEVLTNLDKLKTTFNGDPLIKTDILTVERNLKKMDEAITWTKDVRDAIINEAAYTRDRAKEIVSVTVPKYEKFAADMKENRGNVGWVGNVSKAIPTLLGLATQDYKSLSAAPSTAARLLERNDAIAGMATAAADAMTELAKNIAKRVKAA